MDNFVKADLYLKFGKTYLSLGKISEATEYFQKCNTLASENQYNKIVQESAEQLYLMADKRGDALAALSYLETSTKLKDSIFGVEKTRRSAELKLKYDNVQTERDIQSLRFQQDRTILISSLLLLMMVAGFLVYIARLSAKNNALLEVKKPRDPASKHPTDRIERGPSSICLRRGPRPQRTAADDLQLCQPSGDPFWQKPRPGGSHLHAIRQRFGKKDEHLAHRPARIFLDF